MHPLSFRWPSWEGGGLGAYAVFESDLCWCTDSKCILFIRCCASCMWVRPFKAQSVLEGVKVGKVTSEGA
jgi:hypothetical protein